MPNIVLVLFCYIISSSAFMWLTNQRKVSKATLTFESCLTKTRYNTAWIGCISPVTHGCLYISINSLRPRQNGRHFADDIFKCFFFNENIWILIIISLKFVSKGPINNVPALVQIMAWRRPGDQPLSESMMLSLPTHICVTRPQWVNEDRFVIIKHHVFHIAISYSFGRLCM